MFSEASEIIKLIGGLSGLASGAFLIYDRLFRDQPLLYFVPHENKCALCMKNASEETIIIDEIDIDPPIVRLNRADDLRTVNQERTAIWYPQVNDQEALRVFIVLKPGAERIFNLHRSAAFEEADEGLIIRLRCKWRNTRKPLPIVRSLILKAYVKDIRALRETSLAGKV